MDTQRIRHLLDQRDALDEQIKDAIGGEVVKKPIKCGKCGQENHTARRCPQREYDGQAGK